MKIRSCVQLLLGAVCVVALPAPVLLATTSKGAAFLRSLKPGVPLSHAATLGANPPGVRLIPGTAIMIDERATPAATPPGTPAVQIEPLPSREFPVKVENINTNERATFLIGDNGRTRPEQAMAIEHFFRCRRTGRHKPLAEGVLALLVDVARRWPGRVIEVVSGYRAPPFGVRHSRHFAGHAIDLRVRGVRTARVRDFVWRRHHEVGVGHYTAQNFLHIDTRPGHPDTAWSSLREDSRPIYDPRWAKRARRGRPIAGTLASLGSTAR